MLEGINQTFDHSAAKWIMGAGIGLGGLLIGIGLGGHIWKVTLAGAFIEGCSLAVLAYKISRVFSEKKKQIDLRDPSIATEKAIPGYTPPPGTDLGINWRPTGGDIDFSKPRTNKMLEKRICLDHPETFNKEHMVNNGL